MPWVCWVRWEPAAGVGGLRVLGSSAGPHLAGQDQGPSLHIQIFKAASRGEGAEPQSSHRTPCLTASLPPHVSLSMARAQDSSYRWEALVWGQGLSPCFPHGTFLTSHADPTCLSPSWPCASPLTPLGSSPLLKTSPGVNVCLGLRCFFHPLQGGEKEAQKRDREKVRRDKERGTATDTEMLQLQIKRCWTRAGGGRSKETEPDPIQPCPPYLLPQTTEPLSTAQDGTESPHLTPRPAAKLQLPPQHCRHSLPWP